MARMTDILKDIQDEFNTVEVAFFGHIGAIGVYQDKITHTEDPNEMAKLESMEKRTSLPSHTAVPMYSGSTLKMKYSLDERSRDGHARATRCQRCGSTTHIDQCPTSQDQTGGEVDTRYRSRQSHRARVAPRQAPRQAPYRPLVVTSGIVVFVVMVLTRFGR
jgi:hypothetical protein